MFLKELVMYQGIFIPESPFASLTLRFELPYDDPLRKMRQLLLCKRGVPPVDPRSQAPSCSFGFSIHKPPLSVREQAWACIAVLTKDEVFFITAFVTCLPRLRAY